MLPTASTLIRAVVVAMSGTTTDAMPLFGTLAASTIGNVVPPLVEREIFTLAALPLAFQVTFRLVRPGTLMAVFGAVTAKGVAAPSIVTAEVAVLIPPPLARLSRATTWKVMTRE